MKPKLLLVAGWAFDAAAMTPLAAELSSGFDVETLAASDSIPVGGPFFLVGWSLGGMSALEATLKDPTSVAALCLISSTARFCADADSPHGVPPAEIRAMMLGCKRRPVPTLRKFYERTAAPAVVDPDQAERLAERLAGGDSEILIDGLEYLGRADLRRIDGQSMPATLILHGRQDRVISPDAADDLARRIPGSVLRTFDDVGHDLPLRNPQRVAAEIAEFWKQHAGVTRPRQ